MQIKDLKAGVVYAHRTGNSGEYTPIVLLDAQLREFRLQSRSSEMNVFRLAGPGAKLQLKPPPKSWSIRNFVQVGYVALSIPIYGRQNGELDCVAPEQYSDPEWRMASLRGFIPGLPKMVEDYTLAPHHMSATGPLMHLEAVSHRNIAGTWENVVEVYSSKIGETEAKNAALEEKIALSDTLARRLAATVREIVPDRSHGISSQRTVVKRSYNKEFPDWIESRAGVTFEPEALLDLLTSLGVEVHS